MSQDALMIYIFHPILASPIGITKTKRSLLTVSPHPRPRRVDLRHGIQHELRES